MASEARKGETYTVSDDAFMLEYHFNGQRVTALADSGMFDWAVEVECHCCGSTIMCNLSDLID